MKRPMVSRVCAIAGVLALALSLVACTASKEAEKQVKDTVAQSDAESTRGLRADPRGRSNVVESDDLFLGDQAVRTQRGESLPPELEAADSLTFATQQTMTIGELAALLAQRTGVEFVVGNVGNAAEAQPVQFAYEGPLSRLLDAVTQRTGIRWRYRGGKVEFYRYETRTFVLYALPSDLNLSSTLSASAQGQAGSSSGSTLSSNSTISSTSSSQTQIKIWGDVIDTLTKLAGKDGQVQPSQGTGTITVICPPEAMEGVARYIEQTNNRLARQVAFDVRVLSVSIDDEDNWGLDLTLAFTKAGLRSISGSGASSLFTNSSAGVSAITGSNFPSAGQFWGGVLQSASGSLAPFEGSAVAAQALASIGNVGVIYHNTVVTQNNRPVPVQHKSSETYLASTESVLVANAGSSTSEQTNVVTYGFDMLLLPRVLAGGRVMLSLNLSISDLTNLRTLPSGIEAPELTADNLQNTLVMNSGDTLMIGSYDQKRGQQTQSGTGIPGIPLPSGSYQNASKRAATVVLVTPVVQRSPLMDPYAGNQNSVYRPLDE